MLKPCGRGGKIDQFTAGPPLIVGIALGITVPTVKLNGLSLYESECGGMVDGSIIWIAIVVEPLPPAFVAVMGSCKW